MQDYYAKHRYYSRLYWRNWPKLASWVFQLAHARYLDQTMSFAKILFATDFTAREYGRLFRLMPDLYRMKKCIAKLDYLVDSSKAMDIVALGRPQLGPKLCQFLEKLLDKSDVACLQQLVQQQRITEKELCAFGNLLAYLLFCQAELTLCYDAVMNTQQKASIREQLAQCNLKISGVYLTLVVHLVKKDRRVAAIVNRTQHPGLNYQHLQRIYPSAIRAGELMQIAHDVVEFRHDLQEEAKIGKLNANYFLAKLETRGQLTNTVRFNHLPSRAVSLYELPKSLQCVFAEISNYYNNQLAKTSWGTRLIYGLLWEYEKQIGFFVNKPQHYQKNLSKYNRTSVACNKLEGISE